MCHPYMVHHHYCPYYMQQKIPPPVPLSYISDPKLLGKIPVYTTPVTNTTLYYCIFCHNYTFPSIWHNWKTLPRYPPMISIGRWCPYCLCLIYLQHLNQRFLPYTLLWLLTCKTLDIKHVIPPHWFAVCIWQRFH